MSGARRAVGALVLAALAGEIAVELVTSPDSAINDFFSTWVHVALILASGAGCLVRGLTQGRRGRAWVCFGLALTSFATGEAIASFVYTGSIPLPSTADVFWILWYPFAIAGLVLLVLDRIPRFELHRWIDGLAIVLLVAIPGVSLVLDPAAHESVQRGLEAVLNFAYPLADLLLIGAVVGVLPLTAWRPGWVWILLGQGLLLMAVADAVYSVQAAARAYTGGVYDFLWSGGALLIAYAAWQPSERPVEAPRLVGWKVIALPVAAQVVAVAIQIYAYFHHIPESERLLTAAVLILAIIQIIVTRPRAAPAPGGG
jgi:hypothetical protein